MFRDRFPFPVFLPFCLVTILLTFLWLGVQPALGQDEAPGAAQEREPVLVPDELPQAEPVMSPAVEPGEPAEEGEPPEGFQEAQARDRLWAQIELALRAEDGARLEALAEQAPEAWQPLLDGLRAETAAGPAGITPSSLEPDDTNIAGINGAGCSYLTISAAINAAASGDTIYILPGTYTELLPEIYKKDLLFVPATRDCAAEDTGAFSSSVIIDGGGGSVDSTGGLLEIDSSTVTFRHMTLRNATSTYGGILYIDNGTRLTLDDADVHSGTASSLGGGVRAVGSSLTFQNGSSVNSNQVTLGSGGGVALQGSILTVFNADIGTSASVTNSAGGNGGAIYAVDSTVTINNINADLRNNSVGNFGGAIYAENSFIDIIGAQLHDNVGPQSGGAIYLTGGTSELSLDGVELHDNQANSAGSNAGGGAIYADGGIPITINSSDLRNNSTNNIGGALVGRTNTDVIITNSTLITNSASSSGGAIYMAQSPSSLDISGSALTDNEAGSSGGAIQATFTPVTLDNVTLDYNRADYGGAIRLSSADAWLSNDTQVIYNNAQLNGGGIYVTNGLVSVDTSTFALNVANDPGGGNTNHGGGIYGSAATLVFTDTYLTLNTARHKGGAIYLTGSGSSVAMSEGGFSANQTTNSTSNGGGGAVYADGFMPLTFTSAIIEGNSAVGSGGAFHLRSGPQLLLTGSFVMYNTSSGSGGGIYSANSNSSVTIEDGGLLNNTASTTGGGIQATFTPVLLQNTEVYENEADSGGALYIWLAEATLDNVAVHDNTASASGGGIYGNQAEITLRSSLDAGPDVCDPASLAADTYCMELRDNSAGEYGGGIYVTGSSSASASGTYTATQAAFMNNRALLGGAALYTGGLTPTVTLENVLFMGNTGANAVEVSAAANVTIDSSSLVANFDNPLYVTSSSAQMSLTNSILWDNLSGPYVAFGAPFTRFCNHSQATAGGQSMGASGTDPQFEVTARGQYRLSAGSPARDACNDGPAGDLDGLARPQGTSYDRGAFERLCPMPATTVTPTIAASGSDVQLNWAAVGGASGYHIYRLANDPYGTPVVPYDTDTASPYVDSGAAGDPAINYTYFVEAINECGSSGVSIGPLGEFDFGLVPGS